MFTKAQERILLVDDNPIFRNALADRLRNANLDVIAVGSGEAAFRTLRDWSERIDWLYTRAALPGLIDGWILADEFHGRHPHRSVVIATTEQRLPQKEIVLVQPVPSAVVDELLHLIDQAEAGGAVDIGPGDRQRAA